MSVKAGEAQLGAQTLDGELLTKLDQLPFSSGPLCNHLDGPLGGQWIEEACGHEVGDGDLNRAFALANSTGVRQGASLLRPSDRVVVDTAQGGCLLAT